MHLHHLVHNLDTPGLDLGELLVGQLASALLDWKKISNDVEGLSQDGAKLTHFSPLRRCFGGNGNHLVFISNMMPYSGLTHSRGLVRSDLGERNAVEVDDLGTLHSELKSALIESK